ncbi:MAG: hypothetical protein ACXWDO_00425 [Bacteroidia bacterium]
MYVVRDIFQLKFGHYRDAKALIDEAVEKNMMPEAKFSRVLSDFTGDAYRLIFEEGFDSLADYEKNLTGGMATEDWQKWYGRFKEHVVSSHREILKQVL